MSSLYTIASRAHRVSFTTIERLLPAHLTVLCYHRITDRSSPEFYGYPPNASATPENFATQLDYLKRNYSVIKLESLVEWARGSASLPHRPLLITFDDGYRDNLTQAIPALEAKGLSAVFFIATKFVGGMSAFPWDYAANAISNSTRSGTVALPLIGMTDLDINRMATTRRFVGMLQNLTGYESENVLNALSKVLDVPPLGKAPDGLHLTWDDLRTMSKNGHAISAHTVSHPNLGIIPPEQAKFEIKQSRAAIEKKLGVSVISFAYPYGREKHYTPDAESELARQGFSFAFSSRGGFGFVNEIRTRPFAMRRVMIGYRDIGDKFIAKIALGARLRGRS